MSRCMLIAAEAGFCTLYLVDVRSLVQQLHANIKEASPKYEMGSVTSDGFKSALAAFKARQSS